MLCDVEWAEDGTYAPGEEFSPERFFNDCLMNSSQFDLKLGYFNSAAISILADGFASFIARGGRMRLIINQIVSSKDKQAIRDAEEGNFIDCVDLSNFETLRTTFDEYQEQFFNCLSYMIAHNTIDIRIIKPQTKTGIAHTKSGQFRDGDSITSFTGSANFTVSGFYSNIEEISICRSDSVDVMIQKRIVNQKKDFDEIMFRQKKNVDYLSPNDLISAISAGYKDKDIEELLDVEKKLKAAKVAKQRSYVLKELEISYNSPSFPFGQPRPYQIEAYEAWKKNKQKGMFNMATGTGKTITALNCLLEIYKRYEYYKAIILVPTKVLVDQWEQECRKFHFSNIVKVSSAYPKWQNQVDNLIMMERTSVEKGTNSSFIIISTYASFCKQKVFDALNSFQKKQVLLIADEVHNMGSDSIRKRLPDIKYLRRIGLSATPVRQFDYEGNRALEEFFGITDSYTFVYSMQDAIRSGFLCKYFYFPHLVELTDEEMDRYQELSKKIAKYFNFEKEKFTRKDDILTSLLIARKRIIHKAAKKEAAFKSIIEQRLAEKGDLKYTLVYVPEGNQPDTNEADYFTERDSMKDDVDCEHLIYQYTGIIRDAGETITVRQFTSQSEDREDMLKDFADGTLQVLTSMKCLDEGVDVPRSELAIFCSSTGNPRQFIQRRGRVLRTHKDKHYAYLHDLVVAPKVNVGTESYKLEKALLKSELLRVSDFAILSENPSYAQDELNDIMTYYGLNLFENI